MPQFDLKKAIVTIQDGTMSPNSIQVKVAEGSISWDEKKPRKYTKDRGLLSGVMNADEEPLEVKFDFIWEFIRSISPNPPSVEDAIKQKNQASAWVSTDTDACNPYCVDIVIVFDPSCGVEIETITLKHFRYEALNHEAKEGKVAVSGKCNVTEADEVRS